VTDGRRLRGWQEDGFKLRASGAAITDGRLLVHTIGPSVGWWALPGGGPEFQELGAETLEREMEEEVGASIEVGSLLFVIERAFTNGVGRPSHMLELVFSMRVLDDDLASRREPWTGPRPEEYGELVFHWEPLAALGDRVPFYPARLVEHLRAPLPDRPVHLAWND
jgi:ADP-ribose pyrophosphatase YjhB (NUDIX family)